MITKIQLQLNSTVNVNADTNNSGFVRVHVHNLHVGECEIFITRIELKELIDGLSMFLEEDAKT